MPPSRPVGTRTAWTFGGLGFARVQNIYQKKPRGFSGTKQERTETMAIRFRRSIQLGPIRLNLSKKGLGASIGVKGLRTGIRADGSRYTETTIPGTGISSRTEHGKSPRPTTPAKDSDQNPGKDGFPVFAMIMIAVIATTILVALAV